MPAIGEVELRDRQRITEPVVAGEAVHAVATQHLPRAGLHDPQLRRAFAVVMHVRDAATVGRDARYGFGPQGRVEGAPGIAGRDASRVKGVVPHAPQVATGGAPDLAPHPVGDQLTRRPLHEARHRGIPRDGGELREEPAAVGVGRGAVGPAGEVHGIPWGARVSGRGVGREYLSVEAAVEPAPFREPRFVVDRQPLHHPARLILVREKARHPAENGLHATPPARGAVEMKDVRQLVRGHEPQPVVEIRQFGERRSQHRDAAGGEDRREAVGDVDVVAQGHVHHATRRAQLRRQQPPGPLRLAGRPLRRLAIGRPEVNEEVRRVQGAPLPGRVHLSLDPPAAQQ